MRLATLLRVSPRSYLSPFLKPTTLPINTFSATTRNSSSFTTTTASPLSELESTIARDLLSRPASEIHDYLSPTNSHLLSLSLSSFLPPACHPAALHNHSSSSSSSSSSSLSSTTTTTTPPDLLHLPGRYDDNPLPQGHHLVYFPTQLPSDALLPDGTDALHAPGAPFHRRMWAGGSLLFNRDRKYALDLDGTRAVCLESVRDVRVRGREGDERVFVGLERRVGYAGRALRDGLHDAYDEEWREKMDERVRDMQSVTGTVDEVVGGDGAGYGDEFGGEGAGTAVLGGMDGLAVVERRELVFMREKSVEEARADAGRVGRVLKPANEPDFSVSLTPTQQLLFRFSALSFNAHGIHLDPQYCKEVEGYRNLLVHGPLSLVLMLSVLRSQLQTGEMVMKFDYRNLAPLFAEEEMRVCVRRDRGRERDSGRERRFDVWIEGREGGYAVKGTAVVGLIDGIAREV